MDELRLIAVGNVDDGKSTLLGRILFDSKVLFTDQVQALGDAPNLALLTDGLKAERERGITIDVAYRFFATARRKFVLVDAPGHLQYTRNLVTGASNADVGLIVIDASRGIQEQTRRHLYLLSLLRVESVIVCINKMDLVSYEKAVFDRIRNEFISLAANAEIESLSFLPISSLLGENVVRKSSLMPWDSQPPLLELLEKLPPHPARKNKSKSSFRFPIQGVLDLGSNRRAYTGMVMGGSARVGDEVQILPSMARAKISRIHRYPEELQACALGDCVAIETASDQNLSRGAMFASDPGPVSSDLAATICWFSEKELHVGERLRLRHGTHESVCEIREIMSKIDFRDFSESASPSRLAANEIGRIKIHVNPPLFCDSYAENKLTGSAVLIDDTNCSTVAAVMFS